MISVLKKVPGHNCIHLLGLLLQRFAERAELYGCVDCANVRDIFLLVKIFERPLVHSKAVKLLM